ncbi:ATP-binding protein [Pseudonocardia halophobica]|uniref:ATP-binding protein n=1 Tax=Pseudonocardia halophobica TaxID=29401 RepID=UPI003D93E6C8
MALKAEMWAPGVARAELTAWLETLAWPAAEASAITAAVDEAVANAVLHAYPPVEDAGADAARRSGKQVSVEAKVVRSTAGTRRMRVVVRDSGCWNPLGELDPKGSGFKLMRAAMDEVQVLPGDLWSDAAGTEVTLLSRPVADGPG